MNEIQTCGVCNQRFWPEQGHGCPYTRMADVPPRLGVYQSPPVAADEIRRIVREEIRSALGKRDE